MGERIAYIEDEIKHAKEKIEKGEEKIEKVEKKIKKVEKKIKKVEEKIWQIEKVEIENEPDKKELGRLRRNTEQLSRKAEQLSRKAERLSGEKNHLTLLLNTLYQQQPKATGISHSVWQQPAPPLVGRIMPLSNAIDDKANEQGTKRKVFEQDMETETANRDRKKRRFWKASRKPVALPAQGTSWYQGRTERNRTCSFVNVL